MTPGSAASPVFHNVGVPWLSWRRGGRTYAGAPIGVMALLFYSAGFLGTVVGMINSFDVLAKEGMNNPGAVAEGISQALITTAGGLVVAVAVLPFYNWFTTRIGAFVNEIETATNFLFETLDEMGHEKAR